VLRSFRLAVVENHLCQYVVISSALYARAHLLRGSYTEVM